MNLMPFNRLFNKKTMPKIFSYFILIFLSTNAFAQTEEEEGDNNNFDPNTYTSGANVKSYCSQKVLNQTPTKLISLGYEQNFSFKNNFNEGEVHNISGMGGIRFAPSVLAVSNTKMILSVGGQYASNKISSNYTFPLNASMNQIYQNRMDLIGLNALIFKPLNKKNFITAQISSDYSQVSSNNNLTFNAKGLTYYGTVIFGWKNNERTMWGLGISRTYRLGRPLIVPVILYNKTFNDKWGVECLLPARANLRYNLSSNSLLLAGVELEGQQYFVQNNNIFLQRGEIKPRITYEQRLKGFIWLSLQAGYRLNGRFNLVNKYNGQEANEIGINNLGSGPYINLSFNFVSP